MARVFNIKLSKPEPVNRFEHLVDDINGDDREKSEVARLIVDMIRDNSVEARELGIRRAQERIRESSRFNSRSSARLVTKTSADDGGKFNSYFERMLEQAEYDPDAQDDLLTPDEVADAVLFHNSVHGDGPGDLTTPNRGASKFICTNCHGLNPSLRRSGKQVNVCKSCNDTGLVCGNCRNVGAKGVRCPSCGKEGTADLNTESGRKKFEDASGKPLVTDNPAGEAAEILSNFTTTGGNPEELDDGVSIDDYLHDIVSPTSVWYEYKDHISDEEPVNDEEEEDDSETVEPSTARWNSVGRSVRAVGSNISFGTSPLLTRKHKPECVCGGTGDLSKPRVKTSKQRTAINKLIAGMTSSEPFMQAMSRINKEFSGDDRDREKESLLTRVMQCPGDGAQ